MTSVSRKEGFRYGFYVFAYWLVLLVFSAALVAAGGYIVEMQSLGDVGLNEDTALAVLGGFVALLGVLVFGSGQMGLTYKLVADGVSVGSGAGNRDASGSVTDSEGAQVGAETATAADETATGASAGAASAGTTTAGPEASERVSRARQEDGPQPEPEPEPAGEPSRQPAEVGGGSPDQGDTAAESDDPAPRPRARSASETPDDGAASADRPEQPAGEGDGADPQTAGTRQTGPGDEGDEEPGPGERESPADVASESEIAEELGFEGNDEQAASSAGGPDTPADPTRGEGPPVEGPPEEQGDTVASDSDGRTAEEVETAETVIDSDAGGAAADRGATEDDAMESDDAGDASALDWGGSEMTGDASEPGAEEPATGTGSLADALADESGTDGTGDDDVDGAGDGNGGDEAERPRWTTGEDHEGGPGQGDKQ